MSKIGSKVKSFFQNMVKPPPANVVQAAASAVTTNLKPHVPLIKFRKAAGLQAGHGDLASAQVAAASAPPRSAAPSQPATPSKPNASVQMPVLEDWQLPKRLQRLPISQEEIDYINRGGPA